ncbi:MAG: hypothetical protein AAF721_08190 [Myxococcota bacterium]
MSSARIPTKRSRIAFPAYLCLAAMAATGCVEAPPTELESHELITEDASPRAANFPGYPNRHLPLRFVLMVPEGSTTPHPLVDNYYAELVSGIERMNRVWQPAGLSFAIGAVDVVETPNAHAWDAGEKNGMYTFEDVADDLEAILPGVTDPGGGLVGSHGAWLGYLVPQITDNELVLFTTSLSGSACRMASPWNDDSDGLAFEPRWPGIDLSRQGFCNAGGVDTIAHELGHAFGLAHSWDLNHEPMLPVNIFDHYDMAYGGNVVTFGSKQEAVLSFLGLEPKDSGNNCTIHDASTCSFWCTIEGVHYYSEAPATDLNDPYDPLYGIGFKDAGGTRVNIMSYFGDNCGERLAESQKRVARNASESELGGRRTLGKGNPGFSAGGDVFDSLGGVVTAGPGIVSLGEDNLVAYARGQNGQLWRRQFNGKFWGSWTSLGGQSFVGRQSVVSWGDSRTDVFVRGTDDAMWHYWEIPGGSSGWESLGGVLGSAPAAASDASGRLQVYALGQNAKIWTRSYDNGWSGWSMIDSPNPFVDDPAAVAWGPGRIDLFARGHDDALWHYSASHGTAHDWESLGGTLTSSPGASAWGPQRLDVFGRGQDNALWYRFYDDEGWGNWMRIGGSLTAAPDVVSRGYGRIDVVARGASNDVMHTGYTIQTPCSAIVPAC